LINLKKIGSAFKLNLDGGKSLRINNLSTKARWVMQYYHIINLYRILLLVLYFIDKIYNQKLIVAMRWSFLDLVTGTQ